jgi:hypothetical protein
MGGATARTKPEGGGSGRQGVTPSEWAGVAVARVQNAEQRVAPHT